MPAKSKLVIDFDVSELRRVSAWLHDTGKDLNVPEALMWNFDLCAHEAIANTLSYAEEGDRAWPIELEFTVDGGEASLSIRDRAHAFNPLDVSAHEQAASLQDAQIGGLGIHLIRNLMGRCSYERQNQWNCLVLKARLPG